MTGPSDRWKIRAFKVVRWATPLMALLLIGLVYFLGIRTERTGFVREVLDPGLKRITTPVLNAFRGGVPDVPEFIITLNDVSRDSLVWIEDKARNEGWLAPEANAWFSGTVAVEDSTYNVVIGLQEGHRTGQENLQPMALRMRLHQADTLSGMRLFDLVPVADGGPLRAWFMARVLRAEGLPALPRAFVEAGRTYRSTTLHCMEGLMDSSLFSRWGRGHAPLVWFGDELLATGRMNGTDLQFERRAPLQVDWMAAPIMTGNTTMVGGDQLANQRQQKAIRTLEAFRSGKEPASAVFDVAATTRLLALCDLFGGQRTVDWWNLRFLPDSATGALVPIPQAYFCAEPVSAIQVLTASSAIRFPSAGHSFHERLFSDPVFYRHYIAQLDTLCRNGWLDTMMAHLGPELDVQERIVSGQFPHARIDRSIFRHDRAVIDRTLHPKNLVLAYMEDRRGTTDRLAVGNVHSLPVEVIGFVGAKDTVRLDRPAMLWPRETDKPLSYILLDLKVPPGEAAPQHLLVRPVGLREEKMVRVRTWSTFPAN